MASISTLFQEQLETNLNYWDVLEVDNVTSDWVKDDTIDPEENLEDLNLELADLTVTQSGLNEVKESLENAWDEWGSIFKKLSEAERLKEVAAYHAFSAANLLKDKIATIARRIHTINRTINKLKKSKSALEREITAAAAAVVPAIVPAHVPAAGIDEFNLKLPDIPITPFEGDKANWTEFWDRFKKFHESTKLPTSDKFFYLKCFLKGKAANELVGVSLTDANYQPTIDHLMAKFGDKNKLIEYLDQRLIRLKSANNFSESQELAKKFNSICRQLEALGVDVENNSLIWRPALYKFSHKVIERLVDEEERLGIMWNTTLLRTKVQEILDKMEKTQKSYEFGHEKQEKKSSKPEKSP